MKPRLTRWFRAALVSALVLGCGGAPRPVEPAREPAPPLHSGPLTDYVSAAGVRWIVVGRPREIAQTPWLASALGGLFPRARLDAFAAVSGVDLRGLPEGLIAGYDYGTLYMASAAADLQRVEQLFEQRLISGARLRAPHPDLRTLSGVIGATPESLLLARGRFLAVAVGDPTPVRVAEAYARRRLRRSPTVLRGAALAALPAELERAPARFYAPGPFDSSEWAPAGRGLLAAAVAVGAAAEPAAVGRVRVRVVLAGAWPEEPETQAHAEAAWAELASSPTGKLFALNAARPLITVTSSHLDLQLELELGAVVNGLRAAVSADIWEILQLERPKAPPASDEHLHKK